MATGTAEKRYESPAKAIHERWLPAWVPYVLAVFFTIWQLRDFGRMQVVDTDAARHAMNGAFIYDMIRFGRVAHPVDYGREYYAHFPALSLPFHPPVFPTIEALFFAVFGVNIFASRLAVALTAGVCTLLLYRLVEKTMGSNLLAACATVTILSLWNVQGVATDVMLECPALSFSLAALLFLLKIDGPHGLRGALCFTAFAIAGVWTKQHAAFLLGLPLLWVIFSRRWRLLLEKPLWIASVLLGGGVAGVMYIWSAFRGLSTPDANSVGGSPHLIWSILNRNLHLYGQWIGTQFLWLPAIFTASGVLIYVWAVRRGCRRKPGVSLYIAWIVSVSGMLMALGASNGRYLFWLLPPAVVLIYALLFCGSAYLWGERWAYSVAGVFALLWFANGLRYHPEFLRGPAEAASLVVRQGTPSRILYAGEADGNFAFAARALDSGMQTIVIPAEKLPRDTFAPPAFEQFCREYGVNWIIIEDVPQPHRWSALPGSPLSTMQLTSSIPLQSSHPRWKGQVRVYRFTEPSNHPLNVLSVPIWKLRHSIEVKF